MDWIFDHLKLLVLVGSAIAYWIGQRQKARQAEEAERSKLSGPEAPPTLPANNEAERVRRIQEEIRRKILERTSKGAGGRVGPQTSAPLPVPGTNPEEGQVWRAPAPEPARQAMPPEVSPDRELLERQQELASKMRQLASTPRPVAAPRRAEAFAAETTAALDTPSAKGSLLADLRDPSAIRRAIILREILGTPVGLR